MRFLIFAILAVIVIWSLRSFVRASPKKIADKLRSLIIIIPVAAAAIFVFLGKFLFSLPFLLLILPLLKIKGGLSLYQLIFLARLLQRLKASGRFRFGETGPLTTSAMSYSEACEILNLNPKQKYTKEEVQKQYKKIIARVHPDVSDQTAKLASIVNTARDTVIKNL
tara:strand:+ start:20 stop:520 length:501 start_codon:yes stop_codon:yes gene_type:complete